jgi:type VI secretion system protein ImpK
MPPTGTPPASVERRGKLALALQEIFTTTARLRAGRQTAQDAESFRAHLKQLVSSAQQDAHTAGYPADDINIALFASIALVDESVLNSRQPMFAGWASRPLQEELFGSHMGGELFYQYLQHALARPDSADLGDLLEVFQLCLLLGFRGRYAASDPGALVAVTNSVDERIRRLRGGYGVFAPAWSPTAAIVAPPRRDPWVRPLAAAAVISLLLAVGLYIGYRSALSAGAADLRALPSASSQSAAAR